jgi:acyl-CoA thioesterase
LGIKIVDVHPEYVLVEIKIEDKHRNGINTVQGGAIFTLADYAFAAVCNADRSTAVAINASISYFKAPRSIPEG